jgi:hypothetical protein
MNTSSPTQQSNHHYNPERNSFHFSEGGGWTSTLRSVKVTRRVRPMDHDRLVAIDRSGLPSSRPVVVLRASDTPSPPPSSPSVPPPQPSLAVRAPSLFLPVCVLHWFVPVRILPVCRACRASFRRERREFFFSSKSDAEPWAKRLAGNVRGKARESGTSPTAPTCRPSPSVAAGSGAPPKIK